MKKIDLTGLRFGRLTVLCEGEKGKSGQIKWITVCDCGTKKEVAGHAMKSGSTQSCGCQRNDANSRRGKHMMSGTAIYSVWIMIKARCTNPKCKDYPNYGGRGISICKRWEESFEAFMQDMGNRPSDSHSIDRKNNDGNYEPGNCRWATPKEQALNNRRNRIIRVDGLDLPVAEWAERLNVDRQRIYQRLHKGVADVDALSAKHGKHKYLKFLGKELSLSEWSSITGIKKTTIEMRLKAGWTIEKSLTTGCARHALESLTEMQS